MRKLWPKYKNWSKLENRTGLYRYMSNLYRYKLAKNDQNRNCTGTSLNCTYTIHPKMPRMVFSPIFSCLIIHGSLLHFLHTSKSFQIHFVISFLFKSSSNSYLLSNLSMNLSQYNSNMGYHPYTNQVPRFVRVCSKP